MPYEFTGFVEEDFDVFLIPGLEARMESLIAHVRPKLEQLGQIFAPSLSALCGEEMFAHVAKHARRSVNPPNDTWVAFSKHKRGYKALPHFQIGMWSTHVFIQFAIIYESPGHKALFADALEAKREQLLGSLPSHYFWSSDHMKPDVRLLSELTDEDYTTIIRRLKQVKKAEALCGLQINREDPILQDGERLIQLAEDTFRRLLPLYRAAF